MAQEDAPLDALPDHSGPITAEEIDLWQTTGRMANFAGACLIILVGLVVGLLGYLTVFADHDFIGQFRYYRLYDFIDLGLLVAAAMMLVLSGWSCIRFAGLTRQLQESETSEQIDNYTQLLVRIFMFLGILIMILLVRWVLSTIVYNF
ncbi:MAG: hypothetical protein AAFO91_01730 [Bacteroidota bacterium]